MICEASILRIHAEASLNSTTYGDGCGSRCLEEVEGKADIYNLRAHKELIVNGNNTKVILNKI